MVLDEAEEDVLAHMIFLKSHSAKLHDTNPSQRPNGEIKRRAEVVRIFPGEAVITRLMGAIFLEQSDDCTLRRARHIPVDTIAPTGDDLHVILPIVAA